LINNINFDYLACHAILRVLIGPRFRAPSFFGESDASYREGDKMSSLLYYAIARATC